MKNVFWPNSREPIFERLHELYLDVFHKIKLLSDFYRILILNLTYLLKNDISYYTYKRPIKPHKLFLPILKLMELFLKLWNPYLSSFLGENSINNQCLYGVKIEKRWLGVCKNPRVRYKERREIGWRKVGQKSILQSAIKKITNFIKLWLMVLKCAKMPRYYTTLSWANTIRNLNLIFYHFKLYGIFNLWPIYSLAYFA